LSLARQSSKVTRKPGGKPSRQLQKQRFEQIAKDAQGGNMLYYALVFLLIALIAGALGFGFIAFAAAGIAKICFFIFLVMFIASLIMHLTRGRPSGA
jgi:uncharacterized membrane protein YtjA (UPF0391 family)